MLFLAPFDGINPDLPLDTLSISPGLIGLSQNLLRRHGRLQRGKMNEKA
jgi:hypothetical protein